MKKLSLTALRQNLFKVADEVLKTGQPVEIERNGKTLLLMPATGGSKLGSLKRRKLIKGDPQSLVDERVFEWHEPKNLA
jgi:antitoxin Phd_YefM of type II toxin-antitoxin system